MGMLIEDSSGDGRGGDKKELYAKLGITPESLKEDVRHLKEWMQKQPHLPTMDHLDLERWLENQLIMSKNSLEKAKNSIERYCTVRSLCPEFFSGSQILDTAFSQSFDNLSISYLPGLTPRLHKACIIRIESSDCEQFFFEAHMKRCLIAMEYFLLRGQDFTGFHLVFDLTNFKLGHLARFQVTAMKVMSYAMKAYPVSFTAINIINYPSFVEKAMALFKPFVSSKLFSRVSFLKDLKELRDAIGNEVTLPSDYGGDGLTQREYNDGDGTNMAWKTSFRSLSLASLAKAFAQTPRAFGPRTIQLFKNQLLGIRDYVLACDKIRCDESKRLSNEPPTLLDNEIHGSFRKLNID